MRGRSRQPARLQLAIAIDELDQLRHIALPQPFDPGIAGPGGGEGDGQIQRDHLGARRLGRGKGSVGRARVHVDHPGTCPHFAAQRGQAAHKAGALVPANGNGGDLGHGFRNG